MQRNKGNDSNVGPIEWPMELSLGTPLKFIGLEHVSYSRLQRFFSLNGTTTTSTPTTVIIQDRWYARPNATLQQPQALRCRWYFCEWVHNLEEIGQCHLEFLCHYHGNFYVNDIGSHHGMKLSLMQCMHSSVGHTSVWWSLASSSKMSILFLFICTVHKETIPTSLRILPFKRL